MFKAISFRPATARAFARLYHSVDHPVSNQIINPKSIESIILTGSLKHIPTYGFSSNCVTQAIRELKYPDSTHSVLTSSSTGTLEFQLMLHWLKVQRQRLEDHVMDPKSEFHSIANEYDRVSYLIKKRLSYNEPIVGQLSGGLSQLVAPYNMPQSLEELHSLSDDIAYYAGDASNDFAWYSKRAGFSSIYVSSELYMLQDTSAGFKNTMEFVDNKVKGLNGLGGVYSDVEQWGVFNAMGLINLIKSQLLRG
ncbi:ubiquinone biosynthesis protein Coq9p, mitochondrial [[Candida] anglica]|uniref:Ubiquinone biosynthesis protein n=1 Tax=[Candida] anglica TaxID=148631 RepID=A0ABP0EIY4_9ASCO